MLVLPHEDEGLAWIAIQGPAQLLLIPGLQGAFITAAAAGDQQAVAYLRRKAEEHAGLSRLSGVQRLRPHEAFRLAASHTAAQSNVQQLDPDLGQRLAHALSACQKAIKQMLIQAARQGQLAALK